MMVKIGMIKLEDALLPAGHGHLFLETTLFVNHNFRIDVKFRALALAGFMLDIPIRSPRPLVAVQRH